MGSSDRVDLKYCDYRDVNRQYDRVVSIEMFEAVGEKYWPIFFDKLRTCLKPADAPDCKSSPLKMRVLRPIGKITISFSAIFSGRHASQPQQNKRAVQAANLRLSNQTDFAKDYAETLARWRQQFLTAWPDIQTIGFDRRFKNMWEYYLAYCEAFFNRQY